MKRGLTLAAVLLAFLTWTSSALATDGYEINWWTIDNGGSIHGGGGQYTLQGTFGQPDAATLSRDGYRLTGGFWGPAAAAPDYQIYLPLALKAY